ncbi:hypothetical protein A6R68_13683, partial [Neotoma lepida]
MKMHLAGKTERAKADLDWLVSWPVGGDAGNWAMQSGVCSVSPTLYPDTTATAPHGQEPLL